MQKVSVAFPPKEEAKPDWWILTKIANAIGSSWNYISTDQIMAEINQTVRGFGNVKFDELGRNGIYIQYSDGAIVSGLQKLDILPVPLQLADSTFNLLTGNVLIHSGTMTRYADTLKSLSNHPYVSISRADAKRLNIKEGQTLIVESSKNKLTLPAIITKHQAAGTLFIPNNFVEAPVNSLFGKDDEFIQVKLKVG